MFPLPLKTLHKFWQQIHNKSACMHVYVMKVKRALPEYNSKGLYRL